MPDRLVVLHRGNRPPATALIERLTDTVYATEEELPYLLPGADALLAWVTITPAIREAWPDNPEKARLGRGPRRHAHQLERCV
jgi:hypothetical protein